MKLAAGQLIAYQIEYVYHLIGKIGGRVALCVFLCCLRPGPSLLFRVNLADSNKASVHPVVRGLFLATTHHSSPLIR